MIEFGLSGQEYIELHRLLKATGLCASGGVAKVLISEGNVRVDGTVETRKRCKIRGGQVVSLNDQTILVR